MQLSLQAQALISAAIVVATLVAFAWRFSPGTLWLKAFVAAFVLDQVCKTALVPLLQDQPPVVVLPGQFWLVYAENRLQGFGGDSPWILVLTLLSTPMTLRLHRQLSRLRYRMSGWAEAATGLILGGLAAIAWDRMVWGFAIDIIQFGPGGQYVYNPADLAVLLAGGVLAWRTLQLAVTGELRRAAQTALAADRNKA